MRNHIETLINYEHLKTLAPLILTNMWQCFTCAHYTTLFLTMHFVSLSQSLSLIIYSSVHASTHACLHEMFLRNKITFH